MTHTPVTVLGVGLMGQALAGAFLRDGHPTTVWNRTATKAEHLVAQGAKLADTATDAIRPARSWSSASRTTTRSTSSSTRSARPSTAGFWST